MSNTEIIKSKTIEDWLNQIERLKQQIENYKEPKGIVETYISSKKYGGFELSIYQIWKDSNTTGDIRLEVIQDGMKRVSYSRRDVYNIRVETTSYPNKKTRYFFMDMVEPFYEEELPYMVPDKFFSQFVSKIWKKKLYTEFEKNKKVNKVNKN